MTLPTAQRLYDAIDATWPAQTFDQRDGWMLREGAGAGKRASAATLVKVGADIEAAEMAQQAMGQEPLFMIRDGQDELDQALAQRGYQVVDTTLLYGCPIETLVPDHLPTGLSYTIWPPLRIMTDIWDDGGVGPARRALMHRAKGARTGILARTGQDAAGVAFVAMHGDIAMTHAVEVKQAFRQKGVARLTMAQAALWAQDQGAKYMALATTHDNVAANQLYQALGMSDVGQYHYRIKPGTKE